jgi:hypothetical protein
MATPLKGGKPAPTEAQASAQKFGATGWTILPNPPTSSLAQALAQAQRLLDAAK